MPDGHAFSIQDDLTLIGPHKQVLAAFKHIQAHCGALGLQLRVDKCAVYVPDDAAAPASVPPTSVANSSSVLADACPIDAPAANMMPAPPVSSAVNIADSRDNIVSSCAALSLPVSNSLSSLGVLFGPDALVSQHCLTTADKHTAFFDALTHPEMPVQMAFLLLRYCGVPKMSYLARTVQPPVLQATAAKFDAAVRDCFHSIMHTRAAALAGTATLTAQQLEAQLALPLRDGGMGLRAVSVYSPSAYFAALAGSLPDLTAELMRTSSHHPANTSGEQLLNGTEAAKELTACWGLMQLQGVGALPPSPAREPAPPDDSTSNPAARADSRYELTLRGANVPARLLKRAAAHALKLTAHRAACTARSNTHTHSPGAEQLPAPTGLIPLPFLDQEKLQRQATADIEQRVLGRLHAQLPAFHQARLTALSVPHAAAFLTALPTLSELQMDDIDMQLAVRFRLGLPAADHLPAQQCVCQRGGSIATSVFASDPDHLHSCLLTRGNALTLRHNHAAICLARLASAVGFHVVREPMHHVRPEEVEAAAGRPIPAANSESDSAVAAALEDEPDAKREPAVSSGEPTRGFDRHADLLLIRGGTQLYVDVSITRPTKASSLASSAAVRQDTLVCARQVAAAKHRKYDAIARTNGYKMLPFVLESYGGVGTEATRTLQFLAAAASQPRAFMRHAQQALSVCLQRGNAQVALLGQAALHLRKQQEQRPRGSSWARWQHTGCATRQRPLHNSSLHYTLEPQLSEAAVQAAAAGAGRIASLGSVHASLLPSPSALTDLAVPLAPLPSHSAAVQQQLSERGAGVQGAHAASVSA
jgi:hypothetical protein